MKNWKPTLQRFLFELIVIFIGVYLAFVFSDLQQKQQATRKKTQILTGLRQELQLFIDGATAHLAETDALIKDFENRLQYGQMPAPFRYSYTGADRPPNSFWQAAIASGAVDLLDIQLLTDMALYYNFLESALRKYNALYEFGQDHILPYAQDNTVVYYIDSTHLKPIYAEYIMDFKTYQSIGTQLKTKATNLVQTLDTLIE